MSGALAEAVAAQRQASSPAVSAFVAASAGSGKTKLLTDRLLRLMLGGAKPERIQCLTFTKAAAAEMAVRLQRTLGKWVTLDDAELDEELRKLGVPRSEAMRQRGRELFATVLDLPGGMRIGTIHAFCQSLLKRFPLEARLSPHFSLIDDTDAGVALAESREAMLADATDSERRPALAALAGTVSDRDFAGLVTTLMSDRARLGKLIDLGPDAVASAQAQLLRVRPEADLLREAVSWPDEDVLRKAARRIAEKETAAKQKVANRILDWLGQTPERRLAAWADWADIFMKKDGEPRQPSGFVNTKLSTAEPWIVEAVFDEMARIGQLEDARKAAAVARISSALVRLGLPVATGYAQRKQHIGKLDYEDLIGRTAALLHDPGAAWVLYKLDGGLDHLLLDEVQDTAPAQWRIAAALTAEFFAGAGAAEAQRTVFAVGDRKQSIYGFQGADPEAFGYWRDHLRRLVDDAGQQWCDTPLQVSFRSTAPVLALVDKVFTAPDAMQGIVVPGEPVLAHRPVRAGQAGRVELWPLAPTPDDDAPDPWVAPRRNAGQMSAERRLAETVADYIKGSIGTLRLDSRNRALLPGDVLVLVRRRNAFGRALVRALKTRGVPVAGLDRMMLTEQPAVADLLTLCDALLLPQDDLALASVLTSPLGGLTDDSLMELATGRTGTLWDALRDAGRADWAAARTFLTTLMAHVDYLTPHALLAEALGPLGGRARLFARLGPEAAEPVDELLNKALDYATAHPPSLQGFVHWLRQSSAEVKREADGAGGTVRIMTVHGAKGLQAPLVILPDTTGLPPDRTGIVWEDGIPLWAPNKSFICERVRGLRQDARAAELREQNRLLYVALTRAEDRLIVCGWQPRKALPDSAWYAQVRRGFEALGAAVEDFGPWEGSVLTYDTVQSAAPDRVAAAAAEASREAPPDWAGRAPDWLPAPPPAEPALPEPLTPSRPENADLGEVPGAATPLAARDSSGQRFRRGHLLHALLQHLPALPAAERAAAALAYVARPAHGFSAEHAESLVREALAVLAHPALAPLFGPTGRAEVPLTGVIAGRVVGGLVDRLAILPDRVLLADYKTNRDPPADVDAVPVLYLRQMAAYRAVLQAAFPGRAVHAALVWTLAADVMPLPNALLDRHAPGADAAS